MAKKGKDDDLSFDPGDELFPLDPSNKTGKDNKPPKGVKGYLKNVVKSAFNLTVKVNKSLYPEVFTLAEESRFEDDSGNKFSIKKIVDKYANKAKNALKETKDVAKDIAKDAKDSLKTGYFVKTEDEDMDMSGMFGDLEDLTGDDFGGGEDFGNDDWGDGFDDDGNDIPSKKKGRLSTSDAVIKSSAASARATLRASNRQIAATIGSTQSYIQHETALFAQQLQIDQERHIQKMKVLKNIAHNIATTVKQNNLSIKAQMEYSTKSLAFTQDLAAMIKEIRDAQWVLTKPEQKDNSVKQSKFSSILKSGGGADIGKWAKHLFSQYGNNAFGGIGSYLGMFVDMMNSMGDMGMSKASLVKSMLGSTVIEGIAKGALSGDTIGKMELLNSGVAGLPSAINNMFGRWAKGAGGKGITNKLNKWSKSKILPGPLKNALKWLGDKSGGALQKFGENAYLKEQVQYSTDRFKMGDPNKVHPFDNKAHKVLTEVIPAYLRKISAGVNHTGEEVFDYKANKFVTLKSVQQRIKQEQESALTYTRGFDELSNKFNTRINTSSRKGAENLRKGIDGSTFKVLFNGFLESGYHFDKHDLGELRKKGSDTYESMTKYLNEVGITDPEQQDFCLREFANAAGDLKNSKNDDERRIGRELFADSSSYKSRLSQTNLSLEEDISNNIDSSIYSAFVEDQQIKSTKNKIDDEIRKKKNKKNNLIADRKNKIKTGERETNIFNSNRVRNIEQEIRNLENDKVTLDRQSRLQVGSINSSNFDSMDSKYNDANNVGDAFSKYRIASLEDSSTHGLVQNIYNLLLSGIDVYVKKKDSKQHDEMISDLKKGISGKYSERQAKEKLQEKLLTMTSVEVDDKAEFEREYKGFHGKFQTENGDSYTYEEVLNAFNDPEKNKNLFNDVGELKCYVNSNEKRAFIEKKTKENQRNDANMFSGSLYNNRFKVVRAAAKIFDKVQRLKLKVGNAVLGSIYDESWVDAKDEKVVNALNSVPTEVQEFIQRKTENNYEEQDLFKADPEKYVKNAEKEYEAENKEYKENSSLSHFISKKVNDVATNSKALGFVKSVIVDKKLFGLKPDSNQTSDHKTLAEAVASIGDPEFHKTLNDTKDTKGKIDYLVAQASKPGYEALKPFVEPLDKQRREVVKIETSGGILGYAKIKAKDKLSKLKNKVFGAADEVIKGIGSVKILSALFTTKASIDGTEYTFKQALDEYKKTHSSEVIELSEKIKALGTETKNLKDINTKAIQEIENLMNADNDDARRWLAPFKPELDKIKEKITEFSNTSIKNVVINKITNKGKSLWDKLKKKLFGDDSDPKKLLTPDLYEVKSIDGSTKLGDEIIQLAKDNGFFQILAHIPTGIGKAKYLQSISVSGLEKYKTGLGEYISNAGSDLKNKVTNIGKTVKGFLGNGKIGNALSGLFGKAKGAIDDTIIRSGSTMGLLGGSLLVPKAGSESIMEKIRNKFKSGSSEEGDESKQGGIRGFFGTLKNKLKRKEKEDLVKGNSAEEQNQAKVDAKKEAREEKMEEHMKRTADVLESMQKDGIGLDKETKKDMADSNEKAAFQSESKNGEGVLNTIQGFINKTGLKNTRAGQAIGRATGKVKDLLSSAGKLVPQGSGPLSKIGLVKNLANGLSKIPGVGGILGGVAGAAGGAGGLAWSAAKLGGKLGLKAAKGGIGLFGKLVGKILNLGPIKRLLKNGISGVIKNVLVNVVKKFAPQLASKLAAVSAPVIGWAVWGAGVVAGFMKGLIKCKDYFKLGNGVKPDLGMKLCSGFANCLDAALFGIPSIACGLLKKPNVAVWLYEYVGSKAAKAALERYKQYNEKRGVIFGVESGDALAAFEARAANEGIGGGIKNGINKLGRWIGNKLTLGGMMSNDEKDAKTLGFRYVEIFKYWKENKFKPLTELRRKMADSLDIDLSEIDEMVKFNAEEEGITDEDGNGKVDDEESEAAKAQRQIEIQQDFRVKYLEAARAWVLENKLAWLSCRCTPEMFKKKTGKSAGKSISEKGFFGRIGNTFSEAGKFVKKHKGTIGAAAVGMMLGGPIGAAVAVGVKVLGPKLVQAGKSALKNIGNGLANTGKAIGNWAKNRFNDAKQFFKNTGEAIKNTASKVANKAKELGNKAKEVYKDAMEKIKKIIDKLTDIGAIKKMLGRNIQQLKGELIGSIQKFSAVLGAKLAFVSLPFAGWAVWGAMILKGFVKGLVKAKEYFKIDNGMPINIGMRLCSGLANCLDAALFGIPSIICAKLGKPNIAVWLYEKIGSKAYQDSIDKYREYNLERAKVFGVSDPDALINFENRSAGDTFEKAKAKLFSFGRWLGNKVSFGAMESNDDHDSRILGFKYVGIFKYWKENKFKPLYDLRTKIAEQMNVKLKDMEEMIIFDPTDPDEGEEENESFFGSIKKSIGNFFKKAKGEEDNEEAEGIKEETAYELQQRFRAEYISAAKKWVVENKLAWLTNKTTPEEFEKYSGKSAGKELSDKSPLQRGKEGFLSTMKKASTVFNNGVNAVKSGFSSAYNAVSSFGSTAVGNLQSLTSTGSNFIKAGSVKAKEWMSKIFAKYSINDNNNAKSAMEEAQAAIQNVNLHGDPNYYNETTTEIGHGLPPDIAASLSATNHVTNGGSSSTPSSNFHVKKNGSNIPGAATENGGADDTNTSSANGIKSDQFNNTSKNKSTTKNKKSIVENFTGDYGKAIVDRLNILEEMHKENLRYHGVAEDFFKAALQMMSAIASSSGRSGLSDRLSSMIGEISY